MRRQLNVTNVVWGLLGLLAVMAVVALSTGFVSVRLDGPPTQAAQ